MDKKEWQAVFRAMLKHNPGDTETRRVYADWLEENAPETKPVWLNFYRNWTPEKDRAMKRLCRAARLLEINIDDMLAIAARFLETGERTEVEESSYSKAWIAMSVDFWQNYRNLIHPERSTKLDEFCDFWVILRCHKEVFTPFIWRTE